MNISCSRFLVHVTYGPQELSFLESGPRKDSCFTSQVLFTAGQLTATLRFTHMLVPEVNDVLIE